MFKLIKLLFGLTVIAVYSKWMYVYIGVPHVIENPTTNTIVCIVMSGSIGLFIGVVFGLVYGEENAMKRLNKSTCRHDFH